MHRSETRSRYICYIYGVEEGFLFLEDLLQQDIVMSVGCMVVPVFSVIRIHTAFLLLPSFLKSPYIYIWGN